jgi:SNF2 family DNA or RNA helicase
VLPHRRSQTIALLAYLACYRGRWGPHLVIVPTSCLGNWEAEFKRWCPAFKASSAVVLSFPSARVRLKRPALPYQRAGSVKTRCVGRRCHISGQAM